MVDLLLVYIVVVGYDFLCDDGIWYGELLVVVGVFVEVYNV